MNKLLSIRKVKTFDAWRYHRDFRFLLTSNFLQSITTWMKTLVMSWMAYEITGSALMVALFTAARFAPQLLSPFGGVLADRMSRIKLLVIERALVTVFAAILAMLVYTGRLEFWHLSLVAFLQGLVGAIGATSSTPMVIDIVGKESVANAISLNAVASDVTMVIGPALGGALIAIVGPANCFWVAVGISLISVISLFWIRTTRKTATQQRSVLRDLADGARYVFHSRSMLSVLAVCFFWNLFYAPTRQSFMPIFAKDNLGQGPMGLGFLQTALGVGMFLGALIVASMGNLRWKGLTYLLGTLLASGFFGVFALSRSFPVALLLVGLAGLAGSGFITMQPTLTLLLSSEEMRGRSIGFLHLAIGAQFLGCLAIGPVANAFGVSITTATSCGILVVIAVAMAVWMPNLRRL